MPTNPLKKKPKKKAQAVMVKRNHQNHQNRQNRISGEEKSKRQAGRAGRVGRDFTRYPGGLIKAVEDFVKDYIVMTAEELLVTALWVLAAWLSDEWGLFPHLSITSPVKRCGKSRLLKILSWLTPNAKLSTNISPASVYRLIEFYTNTKQRPTLILDESQSLIRRGSESSEVVRELLCAGIEKDSVVYRCEGKNHDVKGYPVYCPKVMAQIGELDSVLADRCLTVCLKRKTVELEPFRTRIVKPIAEDLRKAIEKWATTAANIKTAKNTYDDMDVFGIENDRMAEMLLPLQTVLTMVDKDRLPELEAYATSNDDKDTETESPGVRMLNACRELFAEVKIPKKNRREARKFIQTSTLIIELAQRHEEPWYRWNHGECITPETLGTLLRPFGIRPAHNKEKTARGYHAADFVDAWERYLPAIP